MEQTQPIDEKLWKIAKRRAKFKKHLVTYIIINALIWGIWLVSSIDTHHHEFPWPVFVTLGWGIGLAANFFKAYTDFKDSLTEKEYQKLKNKQGGNI